MSWLAGRTADARLRCAAVVMSLLTSSAAVASRPAAGGASRADASIHDFVYFGRDRQRISERAFLTLPRLEGAQLSYAWNELERDENVYDFGDVRKDLQFLRANGKKLFILLQDTTFHPVRSAVPRYLRVDARYARGVVPQYDDSGRVAGWVAMRWHPRVRRQFHKLLYALGKELDGKIEGIALQETAIDLTAGGHSLPPGFSYPAYRDAIVANMSALKRAFPRSVSLQYANFMPGEWLPGNDRSYLRSLFRHAAQVGVGIGAPDLMPRNRNYGNHVYRLMNEAPRSVPIGVAVQDGNYIERTNDDSVAPAAWPNLVPQLADYARKFLRARYVFWGAQEPYFSRDVVPFLKSPRGN